jgi:hypothetical protein
MMESADIREFVEEEFTKHRREHDMWERAMDRIEEEVKEISRQISYLQKIAYLAAGGLAVLEFIFHK